MFGVSRKNDPKGINDIVLYLVLAVIIQAILAAILPASNPDMKINTIAYWVFYFPDIYETVGIWVNPVILLGFRILATLLVGLVIMPLLIDLRDEEVPLPIFIFIIGLFILPFMYLSYIWLPEAMGVLTFLMSVILFIVLLMITRSGKEVQKKKK